MHQFGVAHSQMPRHLQVDVGHLKPIGDEDGVSIRHLGGAPQWIMGAWEAPHILQGQASASFASARFDWLYVSGE
jgi:hypothetical protein